MVIVVEHEKDKDKFVPQHLTTANYVANHLLDRVRHLKKTEPTFAHALSSEDYRNVFVKLNAIDLEKLDTKYLLVAH
jgi:hypothetical protein